MKLVNTPPQCPWGCRGTGLIPRDDGLPGEQWCECSLGRALMKAAQSRCDRDWADEESRRNFERVGLAVPQELKF